MPRHVGKKGARAADEGRTRFSSPAVKPAAIATLLLTIVFMALKSGVPHRATPKRSESYSAPPASMRVLALVADLPGAWQDPQCQQHEHTRQRSLASVTTWLEQEGIVHDKLAPGLFENPFFTSTNGELVQLRGLRTTVATPAGDTLLVIPGHLALAPSMARDSPLGAFLHEQVDQMGATLTLMDHDPKQTASDPDPDPDPDCDPNPLPDPDSYSKPTLKKPYNLFAKKT